jgi:hypothetical protein
MAAATEAPLVSREQLESVIDSVPNLKPYAPFLKERWIGMVMWWHTRSVEARSKYFLLRAIIVVGGVAIPVLTTLGMRPGWQDDATVTVAFVGAILAGCAAWEGVANYGEIWREKRRSSELLKVEGWQFLQLCGKYQADGTYAAAFPRFAAEVEAMVAREVGEYLSAFDESVFQSRRAGRDVIEAIAEDVASRMRTNVAGVGAQRSSD